MLKHITRIFAITVIGAALLPATTITTSPGAGMHVDKWNGQYKLNNNGNPFFDMRSEDGPASGGTGCNLGQWLSGMNIASSCGNQPGGIDRFQTANYAGPRAGMNGLPFLASPTTTNDLDFNFATPDSPVFVVQLMVEATLKHSQNELGVYFFDPTVSSRGIMSQIILFAGADTPGAMRQFSPGRYDFGFYLRTPTHTFYSERSRSFVNATGAAADPTFQHFSVFRDAQDPNGRNLTNRWERLWVGIEDSSPGSGNLDYNDMILSIRCAGCGTGALDGPPTDTPEPGTLALVAGAGVLFFLARLRRPLH